jgi:hypothetical protein
LRTKFVYGLVGALFMLVSMISAAESITGTVTNGTSNKPAAGDDVVLIKLMQGMQEAGRTTTDAKGNFTLNVDNLSEPHLIRVNHQKVGYFRPAPPGTSSVEVQVFDVSQKVQGITTSVDIMRFQTDAGQLQVVEMFAVKNASTPPRTQMSDNNYEFTLPDGSSIDSSMARAPGGQPVQSAPVPLDKKGHYTFVFPLRPGETQFQVAYHLPYGGSAKISPNPLVAMEHFVVMMPKEMQFAPEAGAHYQSMPDDSGANVQVATGVHPGAPLAFSLAGNGTLHLDDEGGAQRGEQQASTGGAGRPGGGLGPPIDAPDPLHQYRWYILGGFILLFAFGAVLFVTRQNAANAAHPAGSANVNPNGIPVFGANRGDMLLEALKEELFQLEVERQQGRITSAEYDKSKAALDQTLKRAVARKNPA